MLVRLQLFIGRGAVILRLDLQHGSLLARRSVRLSTTVSPDCLDFSQYDGWVTAGNFLKVSIPNSPRIKCKEITLHQHYFPHLLLVKESQGSTTFKVVKK